MDLKVDFKVEIKWDYRGRGDIRKYFREPLRVKLVYAVNKYI